MGCYVDLWGYYEGDKRSDESLEVTRRPSPDHVWSGEDWTYVQPARVAISPLDFIERFSPDEQLKIVSATMSSPTVKLWYDKLVAAREVVFDDDRLVSGMQALVDAGLLTVERRNLILS